MRNLLTPPTDRRFIPRKPRGGYHWLNLFGKDWVVKRRKATWTGIIGTSLSIAGVIGVAWGSIERFNPVAVGIMLVLVGVFLICYKKLETKNLAADEIYRVGYDRGKEDGYDEGYADRGEEQPIKPVVVPMSMQRCADCGHSVGLQPVGSVADRG